jgi:hypothetical protein
MGTWAPVPDVDGWIHTVHPHPPCRSERWATTSTPTQSSTRYESPPIITSCPSIERLADATQRYFAREYPSYFWSIVIGVVGTSTTQSNPMTNIQHPLAPHHIHTYESGRDWIILALTLHPQITLVLSHPLSPANSVSHAGPESKTHRL